MNSFRHLPACAARSVGGSISETNSTPSPPARQWVAMSALRSASSRGVLGSGTDPVFEVRTRSRQRAGESRSATTVVVAHSSSRRRTTRPACPGSGSMSTPPAAPTGTVCSLWRRSSRQTVTSASRGTASSNVRCTVPSSVRNDSTVMWPPSRPVACTCLRCTCRYRTRSRTHASGRRIRSRHSVCWYQESAEPDTPGTTGPCDSAQSRGKSTPNCHRTRFLADERR